MGLWARHACDTCGAPALRRHVNRKALDQYASFTDQRAELKRRQAENAKGEAKIRQLIQTLDLRKDEAIERTFKVPCPACCGSSACPYPIVWRSRPHCVGMS